MRTEGGDALERDPCGAENGTHLLVRRRVTRNEPFSEPDTSDIEALREVEVHTIGLKPPDDNFSASSANIKDGRALTFLKGQPAQCPTESQPRFLATMDDPRVNSEQGSNHGQYNIGTCSIPHCTRPNHSYAFGTEPFHDACIRLETRSRPPERRCGQLSRPVNAFAKTGDRGVLFDGLEATVSRSLGHEQEDGVGSYVNGCDAHPQGPASPRLVGHRSQRGPFHPTYGAGRT